MLVVEDSGFGIDDEYIYLVLQLFYWFDNVGNVVGVGIGLVLVNDIVCLYCIYFYFFCSEVLGGLYVWICFLSFVLQ